MATVLIVDDSSLSRRLLRNALENAGHTVVEAADGMAALEQYMLHQPQVVFLDLLMNGMPGTEVLAQLLALDPQARIIVATADIQHATRDLVLQAGARGFISKPFDSAKVNAALAEILAPEAKQH